MIKYEGVLRPRGMKEPRLASTTAACCPDCEGRMVWDGKDTFFCSQPCGGINSEDGLHYSDIDLDWDQTWDMSEHGVLMIFFWEEGCEEE